MLSTLIKDAAETFDADEMNLLGALCAAETSREIQDALDFYDEYSVLDMWENYTILPCDEDYEECP